MQAHKHTHAEKHKQRLSLEARLAEAETGADGLFGGGGCGRKQREIQLFSGKPVELDCVCACGRG